MKQSCIGSAYPHYFLHFNHHRMFFPAAASIALHVALITSNDPDSNPPTSQSDMQNHALHMFFTLGEDEPRDIELWRHLSLLDEADQKDCCTWMGVWCTEESVTSLILAYPFTKHMVLFNMAAAPPTVQFVHFPEGYRSVWENVSPRFLPRDLRYLCLKKAQMYILDDREVDNVFDLSLLPAKCRKYTSKFESQSDSMMLCLCGKCLRASGFSRS